MSIQCGFFKMLLDSKNSSNDFLYSIFVDQLLKYSIYRPNTDTVPLGQNCHQRLINPEWSPVLTSSGWLCWSFLPKPKPTKESAKIGLEAIKGANIPAKQNYMMIWCIVIWYHLKAWMPKELEALHLTSSYEDDDDYEKRTMVIREGGDDYYEKRTIIIMRRGGWWLSDGDDDDYQKGRMIIMRKGRWWLWEGDDEDYKNGTMMIMRRGRWWLEKGGMIIMRRGRWWLSEGEERISCGNIDLSSLLH